MFIKEKHIELSDGDTYIVSNNKCPLTEEEATNLGVVVEVDIDKKVPCCACTANINMTEQTIDFKCPNYFGYVNSEDTGEFFDCRNTIIKKD